MQVLIATEVSADGAPRNVSPTYPMPVTGSGVAGTPAAGVMSVQGFGYVPAISFTRTADTNAYTAGDVIGINAAGSPGSAIHTLASAGPAGGHIFITDVNLEIDVTAVTSGMSSFRLHLYDASPDAILDNAAWDLSSAGDRGKYLGYVDLGAPLDLGSTLYSQNYPINKKVKLASAATSLFGVLQTIGAYTPASGTTYKFTLHTVAA